MPDCNQCTNSNTTKETALADIPYVVHESAIAKCERRERRYLFAHLVLVFALIITNVAWIGAWAHKDRGDREDSEYTYQYDNGEEYYENETLP